MFYVLCVKLSAPCGKNTFETAFLPKNKSNQSLLIQFHIAPIYFFHFDFHYKRHS
jgi:hypothetical protein